MLVVIIQTFSFDIFLNLVQILGMASASRTEEPYGTPLHAYGQNIDWTLNDFQNTQAYFAKLKGKIAKKNCLSHWHQTYVGFSHLGAKVGKAWQTMGRNLVSSLQ